LYILKKYIHNAGYGKNRHGTRYTTSIMVKTDVIFHAKNFEETMQRRLDGYNRHGIPFELL